MSSHNLANELIKSLGADPERWREDYCTYRRDDGLEIWTANVPILNTSLYKPPATFGLIDKWRIWRAVKRAQVAKALALVKKGAKDE